MASSFDSISRYMEMSTNIYEKVWDMWMIGMGSFTWGQDQMSDYYKTYLDRIQLANSENAKASEDILKQVKDSQNQMRTIVEESVNAAFSNIQIPGIEYFSELNKRISDLSTKVDNS